MSISNPVVIALSFILVVACGGSPPAPDAPPSTIPISPAGTFAVTSAIDIAIPDAAAPVIASLVDATDSPDDPAHYLLDRLIATLPDGTVKDLADSAVPYVAAYVNARLDDIAPQLVPGINALSTGLERIATHLGTTETLQIAAGGAAVRTITGVRFDFGGRSVAVELAEAGLPAIAIDLPVTLDAAGDLTLGQHVHPLPYGALIQLGLDRAVVTSVVPGAHDLADALAALVDCDQLADAIADRVGLGSAAPYRVACRSAMIAIASDVYDGLAAIDDTGLGLEVTGSGIGFDRDGDGTMDELHQGRWTGAVTSGTARVPIAAASFTGTSAP
jgi:hypothetical protein